MTLDLLIELVGWTGAVLVLGAYILVTAGRLSGSSAQSNGPKLKCIERLIIKIPSVKK